MENTSANTRRPMGRGPASVAPIGFGCMGLVGWYGRRDDEEARATLLAAVEAGVDHFDTAASYQVGENEKFVGAVLAPFRQRLFIATKCGLSRSPDGGALVDNRPETIRASCDASLARLGTDYIDLFYLHRIDKTVPIEESTGELARLVEAGKIRYAGLSECSEATLRRACKVLPIAAVQSEYSIWSRDPEAGVLAACEELGVTFVSYSPLGRGFLAGNFGRATDLPEGDHRRSHPRFQETAAAQNAALVAQIRRIASELGGTAAQVAIAWVLSRSPRVVTIPGMKSRRHLEDNLSAARVALSPAQVSHIDELAAQVAGERHPPAMMKILDR
ncbi:MAG TPA: aldo/keto reductase [Steroidobacteraceae bacterium]|nr:aldo/keto reductase [Steroidobacteraceae bacterium]